MIVPPLRKLLSAQVILLVMACSNLLLWGAACKAREGAIVNSLEVGDEATPSSPPKAAIALGLTAGEAKGGGMGGGMMGAPAAEAAQSIPFGAAVSAAMELKLIRQADISLVDLEDAAEAMRKVEAIAEGVGGFIGGSDFTKRSDGGHDAKITLRVPSDRFDEVVRGIGEVGKIGRITEKVDDVTEEYVDLDARIRNSEREERELLKLYDRQGSLADVITIEQKLSQVRELIEQLKGRMHVLQNQISLSTIRVVFLERGAVVPPAEDEFSVTYHLRLAWRNLVLLLRGILTGLIYIVVVGWVFWVPLGILLWANARQKRRKPPRKPRATHGAPPHPPGSGDADESTRRE